MTSKRKSTLRSSGKPRPKVGDEIKVVINGERLWAEVKKVSNRGVRLELLNEPYLKETKDIVKLKTRGGTLFSKFSDLII